MAVGHSTLIHEAFRQNNKIQKVYFPIGVGSGIAGQILGKLVHDLPIKIIGVVHEAHLAWYNSFQAGEVEYAPCGASLATGLRVSRPNENVFRFIRKHIEDVVTVSDQDLIAAAKFLDLSQSGDLTPMASTAAFLKAQDDGSSVLLVRC